MLAKTVSGSDATALPLDKIALDANSPHVGEAAVEEFISEKRIGERIKKLRLQKSMGLAELASHTGLSASFLSQLETGRVVPTLRNLTRISMVFSKDLSYFFEPQPKTLFRIHRRAERLRLPETGAANPNYYFESLGYLVPDRQLDPYLAEFLPGQREVRSHRHEGCEFLFVTSGELEIRHGSSVERLEVGDSAYFDANTIHSYACCGEQPATVLIVTLQRPAATPPQNRASLNSSSANTSSVTGKQPHRMPIRGL
jgi:transcriptional regulator with XRE-family HTH domain